MSDQKMDDATRLKLFEHALRYRDWMAVMDVVEDMGGKWDWREERKFDESKARV